MVTQDKSKFLVYLYHDGDHSKPKKVMVNTTIAMLGTLVEGWKREKNVCCWEATDTKDEIVAGRACRA